jgi:N-acetylmuramoyl-L-alanine amidase
MYLTLTLVFTALLACCQNDAMVYTAQEYQARAIENLKFLANDYQIRDRVKIDNKGITLFKPGTKVADVVLYWSEMPRFIDIVENYDYNKMVKAFEHKSTQAWQGFSQNEYSHYYNEFPDSVHNLRIALDPGHFGGNMDESIYEGRYAKFKASDVGTKSDVIYYEADLAYAIALILKQKLEEAGALVMLTRPYATSALGKPFKKWLKEDFSKELEWAKKDGTITNELYHTLKDSSTHERYVFDYFYKFLEFRKRAEKVADFRPDLTFAIHLNAKEGNKRYGDRYLPPIEENYNMAFVPGAFLQNELERTSHKVDFLRLLVSQDLPNSIRIADILMKKHTEKTGVPTIPHENEIRVLQENSLATDYEGVYCRNLAITRLIRGPIVYGESLYQDNLEMVKKLSAKDYEFFHPELGRLMLPSICASIADAYYETVIEFVEGNRKIKQEILARHGK